MYFERFFDAKLAAAGYMIGCQATGEALVVDPLRALAPYLEAARREGLRITHVTETHIHADFASGLRDLATRTGAQAFLSAEGGEDWRYAFADEIGATLLRDGDTFQVGNVRIDVMHTAGHTPEHLTFIVTDTAGADRAMGALTGDFVFVGDVGRPDLLETAAGVAGTMEAGARDLFRSLERFRRMPDYLQIWPGHGAGSACGKALGAVPQSTLGYEKLFNWAFQHEEEGSFAAAVLEGQPDPPRYFAEMKRMNREGPPPMPEAGAPPLRTPGELRPLLEAGGQVVDLRGVREFAAGHVAGTLNVPMGGSFPTYLGSVLDYGRDLHLIGSEADVERAVRDLAIIGYDRVAGRFGLEVVGPGEHLAEGQEADVEEAARALASGAAAVLDVRGRPEWEEARIPGAPHIHFGRLEQKLDEIPRDRPLLVYCRTGARSSVGASVLRAHGFTNVVNVVGGFQAWSERGHPVEREGVAAG